MAVNKNPAPEVTKVKEKGMKRSTDMRRQYKAYDFESGHTYLIGAFDSKAEAMAYCKTVGYKVIAQTVVALSEEEFKNALEHRVTQ